jgi:predicted HTH transcriptional regulator
MNEQNSIKWILNILTEDRRTEFKRVGKDLRVNRVIESIVAMTNTDGGIIILGIDDPQKSKLKGINRVFGIEENPEKYDEIGREIRRITPPISSIWPPLQLMVSDNKTIVILSIEIII